MNLDANYWQNRYQENQIQWDAGAITPPLKQYADQLTDRQIKILIPGCGQSYEAEYLHNKGFEQVYVADLAKLPLERLKERVPGFPADHLLHQDFFSISNEKKFDLILEQTFFCALPPELRSAYASKTAALLRPGGKLVGVLFETTFEHVGPHFSIQMYESCYNSLGPRQGKELFIILQK